jgi:hypothetical protein
MQQRKAPETEPTEKQMREAPRQAETEQLIQDYIDVLEELLKRLPQDAQLTVIRKGLSRARDFLDIAGPLR